MAEVSSLYRTLALPALQDSEEKEVVESLQELALKAEGRAAEVTVKKSFRRQWYGKTVEIAVTGIPSTGREVRHELVRHLASLETTFKPGYDRQSELSRGVVATTLGLGLSIYFFVSGSSVWPPLAIVGFGVFVLLYHTLKSPIRYELPYPSLSQGTAGDAQGAAEAQLERLRFEIQESEKQNRQRILSEGQTAFRIGLVTCFVAATGAPAFAAWVVWSDRDWHYLFAAFSISLVALPIAIGLLRHHVHLRRLYADSGTQSDFLYRVELATQWLKSHGGNVGDYHTMVVRRLLEGPAPPKPNKTQGDGIQIKDSIATATELLEQLKKLDPTAG